MQQELTGWIDVDEFDAIVIGTGLIESIVAALVSLFFNVSATDSTPYYSGTLRNSPSLSSPLILACQACLALFFLIFFFFFSAH
jgi:hypothetical protein